MEPHSPALKENYQAHANRLTYEWCNVVQEYCEWKQKNSQTYSIKLLLKPFLNKAFRKVIARERDSSEDYCKNYSESSCPHHHSVGIQFICFPRLLFCWMSVTSLLCPLGLFTGSLFIPALGLTSKKQGAMISAGRVYCMWGALIGSLITCLLHCVFSTVVSGWTGKEGIYSPKQMCRAH